MRRSKLKFKATVICPKCGKTLVTESAYRDYPLQCLNCDEDFYFMEVNGDEYNTSVFLPLDKEDPRIQELQEAGNLIKMKADLFMVSFHDFRLLEACGWLKDHVDIHLENLLESGEKIQKYVFAEDPCLTFGCIIDEDAEFTADALEDTLHRLIDEGASRYKIYELTRMIHEDGNEALINQDDAISVDLGYYITGNNTLIAYGNDLKAFWEFLSDYGYAYDEVSPKMIGEYKEYLMSEDDNIIAINKEGARTAKTINRMLSTLHGFYQYKADMQEIDNPLLMHEVNRPFNAFKGILEHARSDNKTKQSIFKVKESNYKINLVSDDEMELFLSRLDKRRDILLYKMLYLTGARIQEVLDLEIESVPVPDMSQPVGCFQQIKSKGKTRDLYVPMSLIQELDDFIFEERNLIDTDHSYIFVSEQARQLGKQLTYSAAYDKLKKVQKEVGIDFNFHDLRHTFCSNLVQSGMDVSVVRMIMGHEHLSTTQKYTHLSNPYIEDSLSKYWNQSTLIGGDSDGK